MRSLMGGILAVHRGMFVGVACALLEEIRGLYAKTPCSPDERCSTVRMIGSRIREVSLLALLA
jgi:hypothetical protein